MTSPVAVFRVLSIAAFLCLHSVAAKGPVSTACPATRTSATSTSTCIYSSAPSKPTGTAPALYRPTVGTSWEVVLTYNQGDVYKPNPNYTVYDLDISDPNVKRLKSASPPKKIICYFSAGTAEDFRDDIGCFKPSDLGCGYGGDFPNERWVDYTSQNVRNIMLHRLDRAKALGCDAIDPDNLDAYDNLNGLGLTIDDSIDFMKFLSQGAHARGLSIGLKNAPDLIPNITTGANSDTIQFAVVEECIAQDQCDLFQPLISQNKPVFSIEYRSDSEGNPLEGATNNDKDWSLKEQQALCAKWAALKAGTDGNPPELLSTVLKHYPDVDIKFTRTCPNVYA